MLCYGYGNLGTKMQQTILLLADGTCFPGTAFGAESAGVADAPIGEIVFNTGMTGYQEILTDPSYHGQMVVMTYPEIGNYGIDPAWSESDGVKAAAFVVHDLYDGPLPEGRESLDAFLKRAGKPGITGVDTRALTLHLRDHGSQNALIAAVRDEKDLEAARRRLAAFPAIGDRDLIDGVAVTAPTPDPLAPADPRARFAVMDFGIKRSIVASLRGRGIAVTLLPPDADKAMILESGCDALFLSNGPGDPARLTRATDTIASLIGTMPVMGICLGHQLITWAVGGRTVKMKYGHHGANEPVVDHRSGRTFVTSQNHGYMTDPASLPEGVEVWLSNANDHTVEGLIDPERRIASVQFHPEASPGPHDAAFFFDTFADLGVRT